MYRCPLSFIAIFLMLSCRQPQAPDVCTHNKWRLHAADTIYNLHRPDSNQYLCLGIDGTFRGDAWLFFHTFDPQAEVSAISVADTVAGNWAYDSLAQELSLTDRDVFSMTLRILQWGQDTIIFKVKRGDWPRREDTGVFTLTRW